MAILTRSVGCNKHARSRGTRSHRWESFSMPNKYTKKRLREGMVRHATPTTSADWNNILKRLGRVVEYSYSHFVTRIRNHGYILHVDSALQPAGLHVCGLQCAAELHASN